MKKLISIILVLVALFGLVVSGLAVKDTLDTKKYYEDAGKVNDENLEAYNNNLALLEENEPAYLQGKQLVDGVEQLQAGFDSWQEGYNGLVSLAEQAGIDEAPSAENVATYDAVIEQAGVEALKGVPQAVADGQKQLSDGLTQIINGVMADETMGAAVEQASGMSADQIKGTVEALPALPYDQFNEAVQGIMGAADSVLPGVKDQLAQFEGGRQAFIDNGISPVLAKEADPGLKSIKDRLGEGFTYLKENGEDLDFEKGRDVWNAWKAYSDDSGKAITKEVWTRVVGIALTVLGSLLALFSGIMGLGGKGGKLLPFLAAILGCGGFAALLIGGDFYTKGAGVSATKVTLLLVGACAVGAMSLLRTLTAKKQ